MGSPLAPVFANIIMGFYKSKSLNEYKLNLILTTLSSIKFFIRKLRERASFL